MKIVVALPYAPWPVTRGTDRLIISLLEGLRSRHEVTLVTMTLGTGELGRLREIERSGLSVRAMVAPHRRGPLSRVWHKARTSALACFAGVPAQTGYAAPPQFLRRIARAVVDTRADLVLANYWHLYRLPSLVRGARLVLVTHDLDFLVNPSRVRMRRGAARVAASLRARMNERIELEAYQRYDAILTVTEADASVLETHPAAAGKQVLALPLALDLVSFDPGAEKRERDTMLLLGSFHADFNLDALRYFTREIFPLVLEQNPLARLQVIGHGVPAELRGAAPPRTVFTGGVEDVVPYLGRCAVMVLPMRFCGGVRIRMMEAAAMGTPVVSTPAGIAGMGLTAGREYLEADSPPAFAEAVGRILSDPAEGRRLGENARRWADRRLSMETYPDRLDRVLEAIAGR